MPLFLIERRIPGVGGLSGEQLHDTSAKSNSIINDMRVQGADVRWIQSYVTTDAIHCVYEASGPEVLKQHAAIGGFPIDDVMEVQTVIDPSTGAWPTPARPPSRATSEPGLLAANRARAPGSPFSGRSRAALVGIGPDTPARPRGLG